MLTVGILLLLAGSTLGAGPGLYQWFLAWEEKAPQRQPAGGVPATERKAIEGKGTEGQEVFPAGSTAKLICRRLSRELFVFAADERDLNLLRGPVWLPQSAPLGSAGNAVVAAHRDTHFRFLKDLKRNDVIEMKTAAGTYRYAVTEFRIVDPTNRILLRPQSEALLTLVTCYPFYYLGSAPKRYIVRARRVEDWPRPSPRTFKKKASRGDFQ